MTTQQGKQADSKQGRITRGKTSRGRLHLLDEWLCRCHLDRLTALSEEAGMLLDVGVGEFPWTTIDLWRRLQSVAPNVQIAGTELDPRRVRHARRLAAGRFRVLERGFDPGLPSESVGVIRMMNVLREYDPERIDDYCASLWPCAAAEALLLEGSSDKHGTIFGAHVMVRGPESGEWQRRGLLFGTDFERGFAPIMFRDWLPQDLRRTVLPGTELHQLFEQWTAHWQRVRQDTAVLSEQFAASVTRLTAERDDVVDDVWLRERGYLLWQPRSRVPRRADCLSTAQRSVG